MKSDNAGAQRTRILMWFFMSALVLALMTFPLSSPPVYFLSFMFWIFLYVCLASSWNLIGGYAGYLSFGHVAFFGVGAYSTAMLAKIFSLNVTWTLLATIPAGLISAVTAIIVGYPCLRLRGPYFAVITLCFAFVAQLTVKNLEFLGGADGLWLKSMDVSVSLNRAIFYELMLGLSMVTVLTSFLVGRSRFGAGLRAIKEDEEVAQTLAINSPRLKIAAFALSSFFPGIAGGIYACYLSYIHPDVVFDVNMSILQVLMALFGGASSWLGPVVGAVSLTLVNEGLSTFVKAELARILYGCLFIIVIIFMPDGILEFFSKKRKTISR